jgi:DNA-binding NtrC family response regulator
MNRPFAEIEAEAMKHLSAHDWPGNVRELQNIIERALILAPHGRLHFDLPRINAGVPPLLRGRNDDSLRPAESILTDAAIRALQRQSMLAALVQCNWKVYGRTGAAALLGIKPTTLIERMRRLRIQRPGRSSGDGGAP